MAEQRRSERALASLTAGVVIGVVEVVLASSFAALIFGVGLPSRLPDGVGLFLGAAAVLLAILAWSAGDRGVVGSVQDGPAAVLAVVVASAAAAAGGGSETAFLTVVAAIVVATLLTGGVCLALGAYRLGDVVRFVPYPVIGGFLAGTGWLLAKGGVGVASGISPSLRALDELATADAPARWLPALAFAVALLLVTRAVKRPLVIPLSLAVALVLFALGMALTGSSVGEARSQGWLLGPFPATGLWEPWSARALVGADWSAVFAQTGGLATAVFVAVVATLLNASGIELMLRRDLDSNRELRSAGLANVVAGVAGGIPGFHALSLTSLAQRMDVAARTAGLTAAAFTLATLAFGAPLVSLIPRMLLGGVLLFLGLGFLVEWVWDSRRTLPLGEYAIVIVILGTIVGWGLLAGVAVGLALAVVLFAISYSRTDVVRQAAAGVDYRSNVDRPPAERELLRVLGERVHILRLQGFVFFGTANRLLERIRERARDADAEPLRFLVLDFRRVTGVDSSAVMAFRKAARLAASAGFELVFTYVPEPVRRKLVQGGVDPDEAPVRFESDLDHGLEHCEESLLEHERTAGELGRRRTRRRRQPDPLLRERMEPYLERLEIHAGRVLIRQDKRPDDVFVLESGRLSVEMETAEGNRVRLRAIRPGVVVGEIALYTGARRTADVVADAPSVVLRLRRSEIERMEVEDPELAAAVHRWFATMLADRLGDTLRAFDALLD